MAPEPGERGRGGEPVTAPAGEREGAEAIRWVELLTEELGPRRPTSLAERRAAELVASGLRHHGVVAELRPFQGYSTFALPYAAALLLALLGGPVRNRWAAGALGLAGAALAGAEDGLRFRPLSRLLAHRPSQNLVATIEPTERVRRTVCLVCHLDSSRSGLMFHPRLVRWLHAWIGVQSAAMGASALAPALRRHSAGRVALVGVRAVLAAGLALLAERELRGEDVPGANDNASGVAAVATLACGLAVKPPSTTRIVALFTGCEEAGVLGADAFLREADASGTDTTGWLFLNFDGVGAPAPLRFLLREGVLRGWDADPGLAEIADRLSRRRPELRLSGTRHNAGLSYDTSPVLARGGRALTFSTQGRTIPNYHWPSDDLEHLDGDELGRAIEVGREMVAAIDRGEADR